jgi:hypothetical protein
LTLLAEPGTNNKIEGSDVSSVIHPMKQEQNQKNQHAQHKDLILQLIAEAVVLISGVLELAFHLFQGCIIQNRKSS